MSEQMTLKAITKELLGAARIKWKTGETAREYCERVHEKIQKVPDEVWNALSDPAQEFHNANIRAMDAAVEARKKGTEVEDEFALLEIPNEVEEHHSASAEEGNVEEVGEADDPAETAPRGKENSPMKAATRKKEAVPAKKAAAAKTTTERRKVAVPRDGRGRQGSFPLEAKIKVLIKDNPKREGTDAHKRFSKYKTGMKVEEALKAGLRWGDLKWDTAHEHIAIA